MSQNATPENSVALTPRQTAALPYIASEPNLSEGARAAQIGRRTLARWLQDPTFRAELERFRRNICDLAFSELEGFTLKGAICLIELLDDPDPIIRHRAARDILSITIAAREEKDLRHKLDTIDNALLILKGQR